MSVRHRQPGVADAELAVEWHRVNEIGVAKAFGVMSKPARHRERAKCEASFECELVARLVCPRLLDTDGLAVPAAHFRVWRIGVMDGVVPARRGRRVRQSRVRRVRMRRLHARPRDADKQRTAAAKRALPSHFVTKSLGLRMTSRNDFEILEKIIVERDARVHRTDETQAPPSCLAAARMCLSRSESEKRLAEAQRQAAKASNYMIHQTPVQQNLAHNASDFEAMKAQAKADDLMDVLGADEVPHRPHRVPATRHLPPRRRLAARQAHSSPFAICAHV